MYGEGLGDEPPLAGDYPSLFRAGGRTAAGIDAIQKLIAARLAADILGVPTLIMARTDAWKSKLDNSTIAKFQTELGAMGYKFQFITLAGFHALNLSMFQLARDYKLMGMTAYSRLQEKEFHEEAESRYEAVKHQRFVGTGYFDAITQVIAGGASSVTALSGSTEAEQFTPHPPRPSAKPAHEFAARSSSRRDTTSQPIPRDCPAPSMMAPIEAGAEEILLPSGD